MRESIGEKEAQHLYQVYTGIWYTCHRRRGIWNISYLQSRVVHGLGILGHFIFPGGFQAKAHIYKSRVTFTYCNTKVLEICFRDVEAFL